MITLDQPVSDRSSDNPFANMNFTRPDISTQLGLNDIISTLKKAETDSKVKGIFLELTDVPSGQATIEEIRNALIDFRKSGKFIVSYSETFTQKSYYLASVSDKIYMNPAGAMEFKGMVGQVMFFKGLLDKIDVEAQVIRHGKFKSAVEPFTLDKMSEPSKVQTLTFISGMWKHMLEGISSSRKIPVEDLNAIANEYKIQSPQNAVSLKMVDKLLYKDEVLDELKNRVGAKKIKDIKLMKLGKYAKAPGEDKKSSDNKIAVIYASGNIISGEGDEESIGSEGISKAIRKARLDENVKAIVAFSPGEYFEPEYKLKTILTNYPKPLFVGCTALEFTYFSDIEGFPGTDNVLFKPTSGEGMHGTRALLRENLSRDEYWLSLLIFFKSLQ